MATISTDQLQVAASAQHPALFKMTNTNSELDMAKRNALGFQALSLIALGFTVDGYTETWQPERDLSADVATEPSA